MTAPARLPRRTWTAFTDAQLLAECSVDVYRASGPGGQKRNKTSSAVRIRHHPTGLLVIAEESRSQHENKAKALVRLRRALYLEWRDPLAAGTQTDLRADPDCAAALVDGRFHVAPRHPAFWPAAGRLLDALVVAEARVSVVAEMAGTTTANLCDFLAQDPKVWQVANRARLEWGLRPLTAN